MWIDVLATPPATTPALGWATILASAAIGSLVAAAVTAAAAVWNGHAQRAHERIQGRVQDERGLRDRRVERLRQSLRVLLDVSNALRISGHDEARARRRSQSSEVELTPKLMEVLADIQLDLASNSIAREIQNVAASRERVADAITAYRDRMADKFTDPKPDERLLQLEMAIDKAALELDAAHDELIRRCQETLADAERPIG